MSFVRAHRWLFAALAVCIALWYWAIFGDGEQSPVSFVRMLILALFLGGCASMPLHVKSVPDDESIVLSMEDMQKILTNTAAMQAEIAWLRARIPLCMEARLR